MREDAKHATSILLAEDNPINQKLATKLLVKAGYRVDVANDGNEAVVMFTAEPEKYDIIFMDVQMPELNGIDATKQIRDWELRNSEIKIQYTDSSTIRTPQ
jgi:CheY-like chemotaxis protein